MKNEMITCQVYSKLKQELDYLWREKRPEMTKKVAWPASLGDRSGGLLY
ncbi:MAG: hypothetical protein G5663_01035 [Serratia symbiotica]|nr:hypothetical protein [Serratia symbiotica]